MFGTICWDNFAVFMKKIFNNKCGLIYKLNWFTCTREKEKRKKQVDNPK